MRTNHKNFSFDTNFNFSTDNLFIQQNKELVAGNIPPVSGNFDLLDNTAFLLLDGTNFLLL